MALLNDILHWTQTELTEWQRDAVRRLFQQEDELSSEDYEQLYTLLKAAHGLPDPSGPVAKPLSAADLPTAPTAGETIVLKAIRDLKNVNRIAQGQQLKLAPLGITVVYGGNASGKSGYARVMKRACRARDQEEAVHPDANDPNAQDCVPEATFDIEVGGISKSLKWTAEGDPPDELATIAVFDSHCARAYLTAEQDVEYLPYGLDVVENLAHQVMPELRRRLDEEIKGINVDRQPFEHLLGDTRVGQRIAALDHTTIPAEIEALGTLSAADTERIAELQEALAEPDPSARARELRLSATRLKALVGRIESVVGRVSDDALTELQAAHDAAVAATQDEEQAAEALRSGESLLPGTGGALWKELFAAARRFSTELAYPEHVFPHTATGAVCPLCQQPVVDASERLKRFNEYVQNDVAKRATQRRKEVQEAETRLAAADLNIGLDASVCGELEHLDAGAADMTSAFHSCMDARRKCMLEALKSHAWDGVPALGPNPRRRLRDLAARQLCAARTYDRAADAAKGIALKAELGELQARQKLSACLTGVLALAERLKQKQALESCKEDLRTKPVSDKSRQLASNAVTAALKAGLDDEFQALGISHIGTKLKERTDKGKIKHQLLLDLPTSTKLEEILSEGEQRAIALGSFLAELKLAGHDGGIVFDDPVSSLDHWWRRRVAERLVEEASKRQVIILTHDTTFLGQLRDEIDAETVPHSIQSLGWRDRIPGYVSDGVPWDHMGYRERIDHLEKDQRRLARSPWSPYPNDAERADMCHQYDLLRATIERVIQDVVFNGVIRRFRDWVQAKRLVPVASLSEADCEEIARLYQRCNGLVNAHDSPSAKNAPVPTAAELGKDIDDLKTVIEQILAGRKA